MPLWYLIGESKEKGGVGWRSSSFWRSMHLKLDIWMKPPIPYYTEYTVTTPFWNWLYPLLVGIIHKTKILNKQRLRQCLVHVSRALAITVQIVKHRTKWRTILSENISRKHCPPFKHTIHTDLSVSTLVTNLKKKTCTNFLITKVNSYYT